MIKEILPLLFPIVFIVAYFSIYRFILLVGFRYLNIKEVQGQKISVFIFSLIVYDLLIKPIILLNFEKNAIFSQVANSIVLLIYLLLIFRYYFRLTGKKSWIFLAYFFAVNIVIMQLISLVIRLLK